MWLPHSVLVIYNQPCNGTAGWFTFLLIFLLMKTQQSYNQHAGHKHSTYGLIYTHSLISLVKRRQTTAATVSI